jgi:hypothetical protein
MMQEFNKNLKSLENYKDVLEKMVEIEKDYARKLSNLRKLKKENREMNEFLLDFLLEKSNHSLNSTCEISKILKGLETVLSRKYTLKSNLEGFYQNFSRENDALKEKITTSRENYIQKCDQVQLLQLKLPKISLKKMDKSKKELNSRIIDMNNYKNLYLTEIKSVNSTLKTLYSEYVPDISQNLKESSKTLLSSLLKVNLQLETILQDNLKENSTSLSKLSCKLQEIDLNDYLPEQEYQVKLQENELDFFFQDSGLWKDNDELVLDDNSLIFIWNSKEKLESRISKLKKELGVLDNGIDGLEALKNAYSSDEKNKNEVDVVEENILESKRARLLLLLSLSYYSNQLKEISPHVKGMEVLRVII